MTQRICSVDECTNPHLARGYCRAHYKRLRKYGSPTGRPSRPSAEDRFDSYIHKSDGCWQWTGGLISTGYGMFHPGHGESALAHRWAYERYVGPIPDGMVVDHTCHNGESCPPGPCKHRRCVNPDHLEVVGIVENVNRSHNSNIQKTHCPRGHEYTPENTRIHVLSKGTGRSCRECARTREANRPTRRKRNA